MDEKNFSKALLGVSLLVAIVVLKFLGSLP